MSRELFQFLPVFLAGLYVVAAVALIVGGGVGLRRGQDGVAQAIGAAAIAAGVIMAAALGLSIAVDIPIFSSLPFIFFLAAAFAFVVWVAALADCAINEPSQGNDKLVWVIIIVFTHIVGAVLYLLARRPQRISQAGS